MSPRFVFMRTRSVAAFVAPTLVAAAVWGANIPEDRGVAGLKQALDRLDVVASVLHTGAHPDDENSSLLAWLSRGEGARTAYLSATRGEGGQNLIGNELFETLGVIRTEELLAARDYDRGQQFFTPNYEFGYSKTADETLEKWGRETLVGDFVRVIRRFRPEVIISRFSGTPSDGHGHHQAAGIATMDAFGAAADTDRFPVSEFGPGWQARKLYMSGGGGPGGRGGNAADVTVNVGEYGAAIGRSYHQIAMEGRSLHRTQSMGAAQDSGPRMSGLRLVETVVDVDPGDDLFSGTTARLMDLADIEPALRPALERLQGQIDAIRGNARLEDPAAIFPDLLEAVETFQSIRAAATDEHVQFLMDLKEADFHEAAELAAGVRVEVRVDDETAVPGQDIEMTVIVANDGPYRFEPFQVEADLPPGWNMESVDGGGVTLPGQRSERTFRVTVADAPAFTQPYWLRTPLDGNRFDWPVAEAATLPFEEPLLGTRVLLLADGEDVAIQVPRHAEYRYVDEVLGERRSLLKVTPNLSVTIAPDVAVVPLAGGRRKEFTVTVHNQQPAGGTAEVRLSVPDGWSATPGSGVVEFGGQGETATVQFVVDVPDRTGRFEVGATAVMNGNDYDEGYSVVAYPHIETRHIYSAASSRVEVFDVRTDVDNIGYVEGAGDEVADALRQLDVPVTFLTADDLSRGDLSVYDTIVLGIRAYAVREDLKAYNRRLLDYVEDGGTLIVQYNTYQILEAQYGPYPFTINRPHDRVTVEDAPIAFLAPGHPVLNTPNRIGETDFDGWVQERGLYFLGDWDERYTPLLASNDPGEEPKPGGMVVAEIGTGRYVYTGYAFFRQLPAGVPGAYRLFANLISLGNP